MAPPVGAAVIKGLPRLGWLDAPNVSPGAQAVPFLSLAGWACRPAFIESGTAGEAAMLALAEVTATFSLAFVGRCLDTLEGLGVFAVALDHDAEFDDKVIPALARVPSPSPFALQAGELFEGNAFSIAPVAGVAGVAGECLAAFRVALARRIISFGFDESTIRLRRGPQRRRERR